LKIKALPGNTHVKWLRTKKWPSMKHRSMKPPKGILWLLSELRVWMIRLVLPDPQMVENHSAHGSPWVFRAIHCKPHVYPMIGCCSSMVTAINRTEFEPAYSTQNARIMLPPKK